MAWWDWALIKPLDFRHIADFFLSYGYKPKPATQQTSDIKVKGVRINCIGDRKMFNKPYFEAVEVSSTDSIFSEHDTSDIAECIGLPIFTWRCPPNPTWANDQDNKIFEHRSPFNNQDATFLQVCCDPKAEFDLHTGIMGWVLGFPAVAEQCGEYYRRASGQEAAVTMTCGGTEQVLWL